MAIFSPNKNDQIIERVFYYKSANFGWFRHRISYQNTVAQAACQKKLSALTVLKIDFAWESLTKNIFEKSTRENTRVQVRPRQKMFASKNLGDHE